MSYAIVCICEQCGSMRMVENEGDVPENWISLSQGTKQKDVTQGGEYCSQPHAITGLTSGIPREPRERWRGRNFTPDPQEGDE